MRIHKQDDSPWIEAVVDDRWVLAKVFNLPSTFGVNNGRVSKLSIGKTAERNPQAPFFDQLDYHYDRGLDFNNLDQSTLDSIVDQLENLPPLYKADDE